VDIILLYKCTITNNLKYCNIGILHDLTTPSWKKCEDMWKEIDRNRGCKIIPTGIGSDYLRICKNEKPTFVEVKDGLHDISPTQKTTRDLVTKLGFGYKVNRCNRDI